MANILYNRERQTLEFIQQYIQRHGYAQTLMEIAESLGLNAASTVHEHLSRLENKGYIKRNPGYERSIEVISHRAKFNENETAVELHVLGSSTAVSFSLNFALCEITSIDLS